MDATKNPKLVLHKDTIKKLTGDELQKVAGGDPPRQDTFEGYMDPPGTGTCSCISVCVSCNPLGGLCT